MIPKVVHFFHDQGILAPVQKKQAPSMFDECYRTWKYYLPDYQFVHWHDRLPEFQEMLEGSRYLRECYEQKIWAIVADYVRSWVLFRYGGIYFDTDIYLMKNLDPLLDSSLFLPAVPHYHREGATVWHVEPALLGATPGHPALAEVLHIYNGDEIFQQPFWIANQVFAIGLLRSKKDFSQDKFYPLHNAERISNADFLSKKLDSGQVCTDEQTGVALYPPSYFGQSARVRKAGQCWVVVLPVVRTRGQGCEEVFPSKNMLAYHLCQNSWKKGQIYLETKHLEGLQKQVKICKLKMKSWLEWLKCSGIRKKIKESFLGLLGKVWK
ncbi:MAG: glycosyltransferase family 32 protein [Spirochaetia bacterium]